MARAISISPGGSIGNRGDAYSARATVSDEDTDVQVWVSNAAYVPDRHQVAKELIKLADFIDSQQISGWPL
jgi:hypothetical protein